MTTAAQNQATQVQGMSDLITAIKNGNTLLSQVLTAIKAVFPQTLGTATTATAGTETLPAAPAGFLTVVNPVTGASVKIPYYDN